MGRLTLSGRRFIEHLFSFVSRHRLRKMPDGPGTVDAAQQLSQRSRSAEAARRRILRRAFDYLDKGTEDQEAFRGNRDAFDRRISPKAILLPSKRPEIHIRFLA